MRYELIANSNKGVIIDPTPVLRDIKDTFPVSFALCDGGAYIAIFRGEDNQEHTAVIKDGVALIPKELLTKEQRVGLTVCLTDGKNILHSWECHPLTVGAFLKLRQTQWHITAALSDKELYERLAEIERTHSQTLEEMQSLSKQVSDLSNENAKLSMSVSDLSEENTKLITSNNEKFSELEKRIDSLVAFAKTCIEEIPYISNLTMEEK